MVDLKMKRLTNLEEVEDARRRLAELLEARGEWFLREASGRATVALRRGDWEVRVASGALTFSYWGEAGARTWRVAAWASEGEKALLECVRRLGAERARIELVPRALVASAREAVAVARMRECEKLASLVSEFAFAKLERASLSAGARRGEPGRWARILLRKGRKCIAVAAPVVRIGAEGAEAFLASSLLWLARLESGAARARPDALWLIMPRALLDATCERVALLRDGLRARTSVFEIDEARTEVTPVRMPELEELLTQDAPRLFHPASQPASDFVESIISLAPDAIDVVRARRGETLRFNGLSFARVRRIMDTEQIWFGVERASRRRLLDEEGAEDLLKLVAELKEHRRAEATERKHAHYRAAPEAWLESILRRDITRLDPGLRLAPLHAQFRTPHAGKISAARPVDLLALRNDGRLAVIELKVSEDVSLALQGADYWRRISTYHGGGQIRRARLFGDAEISNDLPLVYLVAPMLRFHRSFATLSRTIRPEIEMYRFDLNEDWRAGVRVVRRTQLPPEQ